MTKQQGHVPCSLRQAVFGAHQLCAASVPCASRALAAASLDAMTLVPHCRGQDSFSWKKNTGSRAWAKTASSLPGASAAQSMSRRLKPPPAPPPRGTAYTCRYRAHLLLRCLFCTCRATCLDEAGKQYAGRITYAQQQTPAEAAASAAAAGAAALRPPPPPQPTRPTPKAQPLTPDMVAWFTGRGIGAETLQRNGIFMERTYNPAKKEYVRPATVCTLCVFRCPIRRLALL